MTDEELITHARELRGEYSHALPNGVGNTIDALTDRLEAMAGRLEAMRELQDMRNIILASTRDVTVGHLLDLFGWRSVVPATLTNAAPAGSVE